MMAESVIEHAVASPVPSHGRRRYLMCPPQFFGIEYRINPWMHPGVPVDRDRATRQWSDLRRTLQALGHEVDVVEPLPGQPDMVFAANSGIVIGDRVLAAQMATEERRGEEVRFREWFASRAFRHVRAARHANEGEGDFILAGERLLAGWGFRTDVRAHTEAATWFERPVTSLHLVDPLRYHLDLALAALDDRTIVYSPSAFDRASREQLAESFPDAIVALHPDACGLGMNLVSDGAHVLVPASAPGLATQLRDHGYEPIPLDVSEIEKAGGSLKCCLLELHP
jgi:N-dimethylarginine dimethylaminohydrolase